MIATMASTAEIIPNFHDIKAADIPDALLSDCSTLFSDHYGKWADGRKVKIGPLRLKIDYLSDERSRLAYATYDGKVVGHAAYVRFTYPSENPSQNHTGIWVTQLVVHKDYRNKKIGAGLLRVIASHHYCAIGIASSHPYAIRALESATERHCTPSVTAEHIRAIITASGVSYVVGADIECDSHKSLLNTNFNLDHSEVNEIIAREREAGRWLLGELPDKYEFAGLIVKHPVFSREHAVLSQLHP